MQNSVWPCFKVEIFLRLEVRMLKFKAHWFHSNFWICTNSKTSLFSFSDTLPVWRVAPSSTRLSAISLAISLISGVRMTGLISGSSQLCSTIQSMWDWWIKPSPRVRGMCLFTWAVKVDYLYLNSIVLNEKKRMNSTHTSLQLCFRIRHELVLFNNYS